MNALAATWVENIKSDLSNPGEFYYDTAGKTIYYYPHPGEDLTTLPVILGEKRPLFKSQLHCQKYDLPRRLGMARDTREDSSKQGVFSHSGRGGFGDA